MPTMIEEFEQVRYCDECEANTTHDVEPDGAHQLTVTCRECGNCQFFGNGEFFYED